MKKCYIARYLDINKEEVAPSVVILATNIDIAEVSASDYPNLTGKVNILVSKDKYKSIVKLAYKESDTNKSVIYIEVKSIAAVEAISHGNPNLDEIFCYNKVIS